MTSHLVIPDPHSHPDFNNDRFTALGNLVADLKPDHVICLGDWADMPSLCSYDRGTKGFEGRRYKKDIEHAVAAQELFFKPIKERKKKLPKFWMLEGNHEHRIYRAVNADASTLEGVISRSDLRFEDFGWEYIPYNGASPGILQLDGISYAHFFVSGVSGRPISGERPAYMLLQKGYGSSTQGHVHTADYCIRTSFGRQHIHGLVAGCFVDYFADFAGNANNLWWRGVVFKENVEDGNYEPRFISLERIMKEYE